jgi:1-deoxy-D-xylulose-5-phosphate reductoisomerase
MDGLMQRVCILGATGSIGLSTLNIVEQHPDKYSIVALTAHKRIDELIALAVIHQPQYIVIADQQDYQEAKRKVNEAQLTVELLAGPQALCDVAADEQVDTVMASIVGAAGLEPTLAAVKAGKRVLLANKESLVMSGQLFMQAVEQSGATLLPVDSEHNAIFQSLPRDFQYGNLAASGISKILLTGSGGPFLKLPMSEFESVTPEQACAHPNWDMGRKISVDSATMMNKGLEFIEACWLFGIGSKDIQVVLHPQSIIHSMVQYIDGSVIAQMGNPDMRTPIAHCLSFPERIESSVAPLDFSKLANFTFQQVDFERYPNLQLAMQACEAGQYATTSLNAANEVAVEAFLNNRISFTDIYSVNAQTLEKIQSRSLESIQQVLSLDSYARDVANKVMSEL